MNVGKELKEDWLLKLQGRYERRTREGIGRMFDELCADYEYEHKYAIKLLGRWVAAAQRARSSRAGNRRYGLIEPVVRQVWLVAPTIDTTDSIGGF